MHKNNKRKPNFESLDFLAANVPNISLSVKFIDRACTKSAEKIEKPPVRRVEFQRSKKTTQLREV
jgi:hypothetical protein